MQQIADLYIRVSTDEQADKGYSQRYQDEVLRRFCDFHKIFVRHVYFEDHSAKTFNRPKFNQYIVSLHKNKGAELLLFTKWDRFSRNTADAYQMIRQLSKLGVEAQAVEQPLDLSVPENKMMLAIYLAQPEVENDRRSLNTLSGMRRAKKEGRWVAIAPIGYKNFHSIDGRRKYIDLDPDQAPIMQWVFQAIAAGTFNIESIFKQAQEKGLKSFHDRPCSKQNFWRAIKNPVYCGKIKIAAYRTEEACLVAGQHPPLISEALFYQAQDVLEGKKRKPATSINIDERFPLRGFIQCELCGRILTASSSRNKIGNYYSYYHCTGSCKVRFKCDDIHKSFKKKLSSWKPHPAIKELYRLYLDDIYTQQTKLRNRELLSVQDDISKLEDQLRRNRNLLLDEKIDTDDYRAIKKECEEKIGKLQAQLEEFVLVKPDIQPMIDDALDLLDNVDQNFEDPNIPIVIKREIVSSIFTQKMTFDGIEVRTPGINEAVRLIYSLGEAFSVNIKGQLWTFSKLSSEVTPLVHFSNTFLTDLQKLSRLYSLIKAA